MRARWAGVFCGLVIAAGIGVTAVPASAGLQGFDECGEVADEGGPSPVEAANVRCERALNVATAFIQRDVFKPGWKTFNPAGCEHFMFKRGDRRELLDWFAGRDDRLEIKVIYLIKMRGCVS